ncbi:MAG TPA: isoleucine--tRNA ligase [bacterium]
MSADGTDYKATLNLPQTGFAMKGNLVQREPERLRQWSETDLTGRIERARAGAPRFTLHDGPPYANGHLHMGHALNKILKDFIVKIRTMQGKQAVYLPGWDCHGLPIELQVDKKLGAKKRDLSLVEFRQACREYADRFIDIQRDEFRRYGVLGRWDEPYKTMAFPYEAQIVRELAKIIRAGSVYHGRKPVHWCPSCVTALAEAEVEYADHTSPSIYVAFPTTAGLRGLGTDLPDLPLSLVIWTTTPWTLPANLATSVHPDHDYVAVGVGETAFVVAEYLLPGVAEAVGWESPVVLATVPGQALTALTYTHPLNGRICPVFTGTHVTLEAGTGLVHTAPGHGQEDYQVGQEHGLPTFAPVDDHGCFTDEAGPELVGQQVFIANPTVIEMLRAKGALLGRGDIAHSYPHCWRCKKPVIFRATPQWFISMEVGELRARALAAIDRVEWIPAWGRNRIYGMVENRPDWCISRQRRWGVPVIAFHCKKCGEPFVDADAADRVAGAVEREGAEAWYTHPVSDWLAPGTVCPACGHAELTPESDILDVWFDSGVSHAAVVRQNPDLSYPADLYLEGSDQHRGWFHSTLLAALAAGGGTPYRAVLTHGFVVDGNGRKMSKSEGNVISPQEIIHQHGAEILRLWVAAEDFRDDIRLSPEILSQLAEGYRRIRNTARYLLSNLYDFDPARDAVAIDAMEEIDRYALHHLAEVSERVLTAYDRYEFHTAYHAIYNYCVLDLSGFYLDILKDRLYTEAAGGRLRRAAQTALWHIAEQLTRLIAPLLVFTADEIWEHLPAVAGREDSVHLARFDRSLYPAPELAQRWDALQEVRSAVLGALERARAAKTIGGGLTARVTAYAAGATLKLLHRYQTGLPAQWIVSQVEVLPIDQAPPGVVPEEGGELAVAVAAAGGGKCVRCWMVLPEVGSHADQPDLCSRCHGVVTATPAVTP